ncbi:MAG: spore coat protein, partial [Spirochaetes bacterium]|nr:spore coat protein [Spirochaetota bacterium]
MDTRNEREAFSHSAARPTIVAEAGTDHRGDLGRGRALIEAAKDAGADCIKFQHVYADEIVHPRAGTIQAGGQSIPIYERLKASEQAIEFLAALFEHARSRDIVPFATPFGVRSARELRSLDAPAMKIASPELNHVALLREIASFDGPVVLSAGVATLGDMEAALAIIHATGADHETHVKAAPTFFAPTLSSRRRPIHLLHCVTAYPAPEAEYNLCIIPALRQIFGLPVGVSDHSQDPEVVPAVATALGASVIEKHITLERDGVGLDDAVALTPQEFGRLCARIAAVAADGVAADGENGDSVLASLRSEFGAERISSICGDGVKRLAPSEHAIYGRS